MGDDTVIPITGIWLFSLFAALSAGWILGFGDGSETVCEKLCGEYYVIESDECHCLEEVE